MFRIDFDHHSYNRNQYGKYKSIPLLFPLLSQPFALSNFGKPQEAIAKQKCKDRVYYLYSTLITQNIVTTT